MNEQLKRILSYPFWRQCIDLGDGYATGGRVNKHLWGTLNFPEDVSDKSFLDIGANDGLFSFIAENKGASLVVASDLYKDNRGSMENGWSSKGIEMLKAYLNSTIKIHKNGIYNLSELNQQFDIVLVNHVINWLDDIDLAIKNLALAAKGSVYISDGFLLERNTNDKIVPKNMPIRFLYKPSVIATLLKNNGFKIDNITEINYQPIFINNFIVYPNIKLSEKTKIYKLPSKDSEYTFSHVTQNISYLHVGDFYNLTQLGWVHKNDVEIIYNQPSSLYKTCKVTGMLYFYYLYLNYKFKKINQYSYFVIKATKLS